MLDWEKARAESRAPYQCRTIDGIELNPTEVIAALVSGQLDISVRRAVVDAKSVVIDLGDLELYDRNRDLVALE